MKVIACIEDPAVIKRLLAHLEHCQGTGPHPELYVAIMLVWPFATSIERFLFPLLPLAMYFAYVGATHIGRYGSVWSASCYTIRGQHWNRAIRRALMFNNADGFFRLREPTQWAWRSIDGANIALLDD